MIRQKVIENRLPGGSWAFATQPTAGKFSAPFTLKDIMNSLRQSMLALPFSLVLACGTAVAADALVKTDVIAGKGSEASCGATVTVHYTGWLHDAKAANPRGKQFDSSKGRGPFSFPLCASRVIKGWDQGVAGMRIGGQRTLVIPSELAYGSRGAGGVIPPDAALIFDIELLDVK